MTTEAPADSTFTRWYRTRIGQPASVDEIRGYWLFALGVVLGILGILLFVPSTSASSLRQWSIVAAALGLALVFAGPLIRLPLQRRATSLVYLGGGICVLAVLWFVVAFPGSWTAGTGQPTVIVLYTLGLLAMAAGGIMVPLLTVGAENEAERKALGAEVDALRESLLSTEADEADLSRIVTDLREALESTEADEADLAAMVDGLSDDLEDTRADEADLAAQLRAIRSSRARFELYEDRGGEYRWRLRHHNGNIIADSSEGYTRRHNAQKGMGSVRRNALGATVLHIENESELPAEDETFEPVEETASQATFELSEDNAGEYRWQLRHDNGNIIADSGEGYAARGGATKSIDRIREYVGPADYLRFDPTGFEVYRDRANEWRWRLVHRNGTILADSGEGYTRRNDANRAVDRLRERVTELEFDVYEDNAGEYRWRLRGTNDRIIADSGEGYASRDGAEKATERVETYAPDADALDIGRAAFELYEDKGGDHRWRLRHQNGNILADSSEGYADRSGARDGIESVKKNAPTAETEQVE
jgi:uncharacterized protein YegP (UPF0339 family)